jgi:hypothetical protein
MRTPVAHDLKLSKPSRLYLIPALSPIVLMRRDIGDRILLPLWVLPTTAGLFLIQPLSGRSLDDYSLRLFALAFFVLCVVHRVRYGVKRARGAPLWHSFSRGRSWLCFLPLPETFIHMVIDPAICGYIGYCVAEGFSPWLGAWLVIAAVMLFLTEYHDYRHAYHRDRDLQDGEIESLQQTESIRNRRARNGESPATNRANRRGLWSWLKR